jgi:PadR family transcriptional regulator, regulatory protein PadR
MPTDVRVTLAVARVLSELLESASRPRYGYDLMKATGYPSGKLYPILARLVAAGWLTREREDIDPVQAGRPPRYLYRLTQHGAQASQRELTSISDQIAAPSPSRTRPRIQPDGVTT